MKIWFVTLLILGLAVGCSSGEEVRPTLKPHAPCEQTSLGCDPAADSDADETDPQPNQGFIDPPDSDGDGRDDPFDDFPEDAEETNDSDADGVGDNSDAFPNDLTETQDTDGDGVGDNSDDFPTDPQETIDTDADGVGDHRDEFPTNPNETLDSDDDGVGDNGDAFPLDRTETLDSDHDGIGDNRDAFPLNPDEGVDSDGDGVGDNADSFPQDASETRDDDQDGFGNNSDNCPLVANASQHDLDDDGLGTVCDTAHDMDGDGINDRDGDGLEDRGDLCPEDASAPWYLAKVVKKVRLHGFPGSCGGEFSYEWDTRFEVNGEVASDWDCREQGDANDDDELIDRHPIWPDDEIDSIWKQQMMDEVRPFAEPNGYLLTDRWDSTDRIEAATDATADLIACQEGLAVSGNVKGNTVCLVLQKAQNCSIAYARTKMGKGKKSKGPSKGKGK